MTNVKLNSPERALEFFGGKLDFTISPAEVHEQIEKGWKNFIVDVRAVRDFIQGHVPKAINLPFGLCDRISSWRNDRPLIIYGYSPTCRLAAHAALEFARQGHSVMELEGGFEAWKENRLPIET
jgi:rhodanese-related sulfurtransferase